VRPSGIQPGNCADEALLGNNFMRAISTFRRWGGQRVEYIEHLLLLSRAVARNMCLVFVTKTQTARVFRPEDVREKPFVSICGRARSPQS
jgi:hypothetical protein